MNFTYFKYYLKILLIFVFFPIAFYGQDCNIISKANDMIPDGLCAPVTVSWEVTYRGVNDAGTLIEIQYDWDDGNVETIAAVNTSIPLQEWQVTAVHIYPPGGNQCTYNPSATLIVDGVLCTSSIQEQTVTVWDTDDENGGEIDIDPDVFPICVGSNGCTYFQDVSLFNCVPPVENDNINNPTRWTQWVYGTNFTINNVTVDGIIQAYPFFGAVVPLPGPVTGPGAPNNISLECCAPNTALVGEFFEVTLRNWNYCNPYDDPSIPGPPADLINGDFPPVITTAIILIVPIPDATITPAGPFCANDPSVNLNAATTGGTWSGTGITNSNNGTFNPSVAGPGIHTITYTVTDGNGCTDTDTYDITVYALPIPNVLPAANSEVCPGDPLLLDGNPTPGDGNIISHLWTGNTGPLNFTNIQAPTFLTSTQGVYSMTYTVTDDNGCSNFENVTVTVNPVIANIIPDPAETCVNGDLALNGNPSGGTGNYITHIWTGDIVYLNNPNIQNPVFNSSIIGTYNLTYSVTDDNGCTDTDDIVVTVYENPVAYAGIDDSICSDTYPLNAIPSIGAGSWNQINGPGTASFNVQNSPTTSVTVNIYGVYELTWTETFGAGCTDIDTVIISFFEQPIADAGIWDSICGLSYLLNASPSVGIGNWTQQSGTGLSIFSNINLPNSNVSVDTYGAYTFMWTENNSGVCIDSSLVTISFDLVPTPLFNPVDTTACPPLIVPFVNNTIGGTTYYWDFGDGNTSTNVNPTHIYYNATSSDITYTVNLIATSIYGCIDSIKHNVTIHPIPNSDFISDAVPACSPNTVNFSNTSTGSVMHIWDYGDGSALDTTDNPTHTFINTTVLIQYYEVNLLAVSNFGCIDTSSQFVTVYPNSHNDFSIDPDTTCSPALVQFLADPGGSTYYWNFGDATSQTGTNVMSHAYSNTGNQDTTYIVTLITTSIFGCVDTSIKQIVIYPTPNADFIVNSTIECSPFNAIFTNQSNGGDTYTWTFGDGANSNSADTLVYHTYNNSGAIPQTYYVTLVVENYYGCKDSIMSSVMVYPDITAGFTMDSAGCTPHNINFSNISNGASSFLWDFGDGMISSDMSPTHTYTVTDTVQEFFNVQLIVSSVYGCQDTMQGTVIVYPSPTADFSFASSSGCTSFNAIINNNSSGALLYYWDFGDGNTGNSPNSSFNHIFINSISNPINLTVNLVVENSFGCKDSTSNIITVYPEVIANYTSDTAGCSPLSIEFFNQTFGASDYVWNFGDGNTSINTDPVHIFENTSIVDLIYNVTLTATSIYGCIDYVSSQITIYPSPDASFVVAPQSQMFTPPTTSVSIANTTSGNWNYIWAFGDGDSLFVQNPVNHGYNNYGSYNITLFVYSAHCFDTTIQTIELTAPPPIAQFSGSAQGCAPLEVDFSNNSLYAESYIWDFGDGSSSILENPSHIYANPGLYTVTLSVTNSNGSDQYVGDSQIEVYQNPTAFFTVSPSVVYLPDDLIKCTNLSSFGDLYFWDFGDGGTSVLENPSYYYNEEGTYDITLKVETNKGCIDSYTMLRAVVAESTGNIEFPNAFSPSQSGPNGGKYLHGAFDNNIFHPLHSGVMEYKLSIYNRWGELVFESDDPNIGWDGYYRNTLCKQDVYVWKVQGKFSNAQTFMQAGDVTLLR